ncbi:FAD-dependent oxidoreductase [Nocardia rhamnosiphila]
MVEPVECSAWADQVINVRPCSIGRNEEIMGKTVVVLGAGVGGLTAAAELRTVLAGEDRVVLIDRAFTGSLGLSSLWVLRGWRTPEPVRVAPGAAALPGVQMMSGDIARIDVGARRVDCGAAGRIGYDALVIALGAGLNPAALPGLQAALDAGVAGQFYTLDGAADLHRRIGEVESGRVLVLVASAPFKCPAAPFEAAFLIADQLAGKHTGGAVAVEAFTPDSLPMPVAGPEVGNALVELMSAKGIGFHGNKSAIDIDPHARTVSFADGSTEVFDLLAVVPRTHPPPRPPRPGWGRRAGSRWTRPPWPPAPTGCSRSGTAPRCCCPTANRCRRRRSSPKPKRRSPRTKPPATSATTPPTPASPARAPATSNSGRAWRPRVRGISWPSATSVTIGVWVALMSLSTSRAASAAAGWLPGHRTSGSKA